MQKPQEITRESLNKRHPFCWWGSNWIFLNVWWFLGDFPHHRCIVWVGTINDPWSYFKVKPRWWKHGQVRNVKHASLKKHMTWCPPEGVQVFAAGDPPFNIGKWRLPFLAPSSFSGKWDPSEIVSFGVLFYWTMTMGERVIMDPLPKKNHVTALVTVTWVKGSLIDLSHLSIIILVPAFFGLDTSFALSLVASEKHPDLFWSSAIHHCAFVDQGQGWKLSDFTCRWG